MGKVAVNIAFFADTMKLCDVAQNNSLPNYFEFSSVC